MAISRRSLLAAAPGAALPLVLPRMLLGQEPAKAGRERSPGRSSRRRASGPSQRGDEWLMKTMHRDGGCGVDIGQPTDIGCTAMVGLALMAQGNTPVEGPRSREVQRILSLHAAGDREHAAATTSRRRRARSCRTRSAATPTASSRRCSWPKSSAKAGTPSRCATACKRVIAAIVGSQTPQGHWGDQSWAPMLGTVMGWVSLRAAHYAGIKVGGSPELTAKHLVAADAGATWPSTREAGCTRSTRTRPASACSMPWAWTTSRSPRRPSPT